jgi:hypothetical protein
MPMTELSARVSGPFDPQILCNFYLWGKLTNAVYANKPHDLEALKQNIRDTTYNIQQL